MKLRFPFLSVALAVCAVAPLDAQSLTTWDFPVKVTASDGVLTKSSGCEGCPDSGAHSRPQLSGDGYAEFVVPALTRLYAGLGRDLTASTASGAIDFAVSLWPSGTFEIRELGVYKKEGTYAAGDRFRVAVESGAVVYRKNGVLVYTSKVPPSYPLVLDVTLYAVGASLSQAKVAAASAPPPESDPPPPPPPPSTAPVPTTNATGPYKAVTDRQAYAKPALPILGPAGSTITDPVFGTPIHRITDNVTRPGTVDRSYRTPSSPHQNAWSAKSSYFYVMGSGGVGPIPYAFDPSTGTARRIAPSATGDGGLVLKFYIEPQFSYLDDSIIYGSYNGVGATRRTIDQYNFATGGYSKLLDLDALEPGLSGTYVGSVASSGGPVERIEAFFGGTSQDRHHYVVVFDRANPQNRQILDTWASTIDGRPTPITLNFSLHHAMIDRSGRYVMLYATSADQAAPRYAAQEYLWDLQTGAITELGTAALSYGHDAFGYGVLVNKDCCTSTQWDAGQWQFRSLASPLATRDLIGTLLTPQEVYLSDHTTWNNARPDRLMPIVSGLYRYGTTTSAWRAWDDEIVAIQTDAPAGAESTVWRFAHHRTDVHYDGNAAQTAFWYQPHPNVSQDGNWVLFTSNWEKTLGVDSAGEAGTGARQDVFLLALQPAISPVILASTTLPAGRATRPYAGALSASGGSGAFTWTATGLPAGLSIDATSGAITGIPAAAGAATVTVRVADAANATNAATGTFTIAVAAPPVSVTTTSLPSGRATVAYNAGLQATGGNGTLVWTVTSGSLPPGLSLEASSGALSGTPSQIGTFGVTVTVKDAGDEANAASAPLSITIGASPITISTAVLPSVRATQSYASALQSRGGTGTQIWSISSGVLPDGIALDAATGAITGTPTLPGSSRFTVCVTDAGDLSNTADATLTIDVAAAPVLVAAAALPATRVSLLYSTALVASGGSGAVTWALTGGSLPPGIVLDPASGSLTGAPLQRGLYAFTATAVDALDAGNRASAAFSVAVGAGPMRVTSTSLPGGRQSVGYSATLTGAGGDGSVVWSAIGLPAGLTLNAASGAIAGTPSSAGTYAVTVTAADPHDASNSGSAVLTLAITPRVVVASPRSLPDATGSVPYTYVVLAANAVGTTKWNLQGGALPQGLTLNATTGAITGTPTARGTYSFNARVQDSSTSDTLTLTIVVK